MNFFFSKTGGAMFLKEFSYISTYFDLPVHNIP